MLYIAAHYSSVLTPTEATCIAKLPRIALLTTSVGIKLLSSSARVTSVKSTNGLGPLGWSHLHQDTKIGPQGHLGPIKIHSYKLDQMSHFR